MSFCRFPQGVTVKPDGIYPMEPHCYELRELHTNCIFIVSESIDSDDVEFEWKPTDETEDIYYGDPLPPDTSYETAPHIYRDVEIIHNVTVEVRACKFCGHVTYVWLAQENTEHEIVN